MQERHGKANNQVLKVEMGQQQVQSGSQSMFTNYPKTTSVGQCKALMDGDDKEWWGGGCSTPGLQNSRQDHAAAVQNEAEAGLPKVRESCLSQSQ
jgi:hypothetical protein